MSVIKYKKLLLISLGVFVFLSLATITLLRIQKNVSNDVTPTPSVVSYTNNPTDPPSTLPQEQISKIDANDTKTPTSQPIITPPKASRPELIEASPKQTEIRKSVENESTFFALGAPNDPAYSSSWALSRVNALPAWTTTTGSDSVTVAVIDTGFALNHEDLASSWYTNPGENGLTQITDVCYSLAPANKATNNCDDDANGYVDDWRGWNFYEADNNPQAGRQSPSSGTASHGTNVAGLVGARGNNSKGIATISWNTKIMPLQGMSDSGVGYTSDIAAAIYYAVDNGADVVNLSLGSFTNDSYIRDATDYAYVNNVVIVAAAGNCGTGTELGCTGYPAGTMLYPAKNDHVLAVGATNFDNQSASFSSYGNKLEVMAPGSGTLISPTWTQSNGTTLYASELYGTSFASPYVASLASLIRSIRPSSSVDDIRALILASTSKLSSMSGQNYTSNYGHGIIDVDSAIKVASSLNSFTTTPQLLQAGSEYSERSFRATSQLSSGCVITANYYCAIKMVNTGSKLERYLPYQTSNSTNRGWSWIGSSLTIDYWDIYALSGENVSSKYSLSPK